MKKYIILSLVLILLATTAVPVMAGNGNGNGVGHGNQDRDQTQDRDRDQEKDKFSNKALEKNKNRENNKWQYTPFYLQGVITSVGAGTITVNVVHANAKVKQFIGTDLVITVPTTALIFQITQGAESEGSEGAVGDSNREAITLSQLQAGQKIAVHGRLIELDYTARLVTVYIGMPLGEPMSAKP